jgi:uncharacterized protein YbjT (DUF2867 family)
MHVLVAGAGVLGRELITVLLDQGHNVRAMALREEEFDGLAHPLLECRAADVTRPEMLTGLCEGVEAVVSCIGITRINGALTHDAVDYRGNVNLLKEAEGSGTKTFAIVSPEGVEEGNGHAPLLSARCRFEERLQQSDVSWIIIHSGGFFTDLAEMARLAAKSPMFVVGDGTTRFTPIAVSDLARFTAESLGSASREILHAGGPETLSWNEIVSLGFAYWGKQPRIYHVPVWFCRLTLALIRPFSKKYYAMGRLIVFMSLTELPTPPVGQERLEDYIKKHLARA